MISLDELRELKFFNNPKVQSAFFPCRPDGAAALTNVYDFLKDKDPVHVEYHLPGHGVDIATDGFVVFYRN